MLFKDDQNANTLMTVYKCWQHYTNNYNKRPKTKLNTQKLFCE